MTEPTFTDTASAPLFALDPPAPAGWVGFRPGAAARSPITLAQAWQDATGVYLVLGSTPADFATFAATLRTVLANLPANVRCLWVDDPNAATWATQTLLATPSGSGPTITWNIARNATFAHGGYSVYVGRGTALTPGTDPVWGIAADATGTSFAAPGGGYQPEPRSVGVPFAGPATGAWTATLRLPGTADDFAALGVGLRYVRPAPTGTAVRTMRMPVLRQMGAGVTATLSFDPLRPRDHDRTHLLHDPAGAPALLSGLATTRGYDVRLTPVAAPGLPPARLVFCTSPVAQGSAYEDPYLAPDGGFLLTVTPGAQVQLGPSGVESVEVPAGEAIALFRAGQPAFAPGAGADLLTAAATTSYLTVLPGHAPEGATAAEGLAYRAQPPRAPLFGASAEAGFLDHREVVAGTLPTYAEAVAGAAALPVGAYRWLDPAVAADARAVEQGALAPLRRNAIPPAPPTPETIALAGTDVVTPQGLLVTLGEDGQSYSSVTIASLPAAYPAALRITGIGPPLASALQADQVFFVVADPTEFFEHASVPYQLTQQQIAALPVDPAIRAALDAALRPLGYPVFETETAFAAVAKAPSGTKWDDVVRPAAGLLVADLQGWRFQLSPRSWRTDPETRTVMLTKFAAGRLDALVADPARWSWPAAAGNVEATQRLVRDLFEAAAAAPAGTDLAAFSRDVVTNPGWNGVLFLNAPVLVNDLPPDLRFVAAGIDRSKFFAHHVALSLTPVDTATGSPVLGRSAVAALISYDDPGDLVLAADVALDFKTLAVHARFANAALTGFSAQVELMVNRLFGAELRKLDPERGNNLVLDGSYQVQHGVPVYLFALRGVNEYAVARSALEVIAVTSVRMGTATTAAGDASDFVLTGTLRFTELPGADLFSYDALRYTNLRVRMLLSPKSFSVDEGTLTFDPANSKGRTRSLAENFPVRVTDLLTVAADPNAAPDAPPRGPETYGYTPVLAPIDSSLLSPPWYGLVLTVDLGTVGALAGGAGLSLDLLVAWAPGQTDGERPVFLGASAGGAVGKGWSLQGVLRLGFRSFQLLVQDTATKRSYALRLRRFALTALWWSFPPGEADVFVFGDPDGDPKKSLGWYAAYTQPPPPQRPAVAGSRAALSARRPLPPAR